CRCYTGTAGVKRLVCSASERNSIFDWLVPQGGERFFQIVFTRVAALIVPVFDGPLVVVPEPGEHVALPAVGQAVLVLEPVGGVGDVLQRGVVLLLAVVALVENGVTLHPLGEFVVSAEGVGDLAVLEHPDREPVDVADRPMAVALG